MKARDDLVAKTFLQDSMTCMLWSSDYTTKVFLLQENGVITYAFYEDESIYHTVGETELMMTRLIYITVDGMTLNGIPIQLKEEYYKA